jgi:DNA repair exonuclease SbcCD ATPase subunit
MPIIENIALTNFGVHRKRSFQFGPGFNVIRGANEAGKSTVLEAIAIAFFGSSALRGGWEDVVTTGEKVGSLAINMRYGQYTVQRSKSSASVVSDDGQIAIAGHGDVTDFFLRHFGIEKGTERNVIIAQQGKIQGILESGNSDATKFIENLANFDQIDQLVERMKIKYPVIDQQALNQQIVALEEKLIVKEAEELPDLGAAQFHLDGMKFNKDVAQAKVDAAMDSLDKHSIALEAEKERKREFDSFTTQVKSQEVLISDLKMNQSGITGQVKVLEVEINCSGGRLESAQAFLDQLSQKQADYSAYHKVVNLECCDETWDESFDALRVALESERVSLKSLEAQIKANEKQVTQLESTSPVSEQLTALTAKRDDIAQQRAVLKAMTGDSDEIARIKESLAEVDTAMAVARSRWIAEDVCPTCGTDLQEKAAAVNDAINDELVLLNNTRLALEVNLKAAYQVQRDARTQQEKDLNNEYTKTVKKLETVIEALKAANLAEIQKIENSTNELQLQMADSKSTIQSMEGIIDCQNRLESLLEEVGEAKVTVDRTLFPWSFKWIGDVPTKPDQTQITKANNDVVHHKGLVMRLEAKNSEYDKCCKDISAAEIKLTELQKALAKLIDPSEQIDALVESIVAGKVVLARLREALDVAVSELNTAATRLALDEQLVKKHGETIVEIKKDIKRVQDEILKSAENNALHRAVAVARTTVIEGVWGTLLTAANDCFSSIRGTVSDITREGKFFRVNGTKTVRLSGSTLDSLGLAMRAAIRAVFCPATDFMLLDEIAAGMDTERTAAAMAQVASLSVPQKILVTHEEVSDTLANHIIEV